MKSNLWLTRFLDERGMKMPDGRHLFAYHVKPLDFSDLKRILIDKINAAKKVGLGNNYWFDNKDFCAIFTLYATYWWQNNYDGSDFTWNPLLDAIGFQTDRAGNNVRELVKTGLKFWGLNLSQK